MGRACGMHGGEEIHTDYKGETGKKEATWKT